MGAPFCDVYGQKDRIYSDTSALTDASRMVLQHLSGMDLLDF